MKVRIFKPSFFLYNQNLVLKIDKKMILGRSSGGIVLEDDPLLSDIHCEFNPNMLKLTIKDLNSTNGIYVNKERIEAGVEVLLNTGDIIKIGGHDYVLYDDEKDVKKLLPPRERRKHPRPENLYGAKNFSTFYVASPFFQTLYVVIIFSTVASFLLNLNIGIPVPDDLSFLKNVYIEDIIFAGVRLIFIVWAISLIHSFLMVLYLNRNIARKAAGIIFYGLAIYFMVDFRDGPLGGIKRYLIEREVAISYQQDDIKPKAITALKNVIDSEDRFKRAYAFTRQKIPENHKEILEKDYKIIVEKIAKNKIRAMNTKVKIK